MALWVIEENAENKWAPVEGYSFFSRREAREVRDELARIEKIANPKLRYLTRIRKYVPE